MYKGIFRLTLFFLLNVFFATLISAQGIQFFEGSWKDAMAKAKAEDKLLFVDAFAKWCGPCKMMAKNVFTQQQVGDFFNQNFVNLKLDMEEADGITFGHKYPVSAYPTLFFIDGDGKVIKTVRGAQQADGLIALGKSAMQGVDRSPDFAKKYDAGDRDYDLVLGYVKALNQAGKPSLKIANDYLNSKPAITEEQRLRFIFEATTDADSRLFETFLNDRDKLIKIVGEEVYINKATAACQAAVKKAIDFETEQILTETEVKAKKTLGDGAEKFILTSRMKYYHAMRDTDKYAAAYQALAKKLSKQPAELKPVIKEIYQHYSNNRKFLEDAENYSEKVFKAEPSFENLGIWCNVLLALGNVQKAIDITQKAKNEAAAKGEDIMNYDGLLNYLNSRKS
ncbi:MAG: thioredoxin family protein [Saprospiraceae bacterium]|nr:thioredoxin family protein [Saprospiraceae bacterium]